MFIYPSAGRTFDPVIRVLDCSDAEKYLEFLKALDTEAEYMHYEAGERTMTVQGMRSRMRKQDKQGNSFVVGCFNLAGDIVGYFSVNGGNSRRTKHSATVAVGLLPLYEGIGLARETLDFALKVCHEKGITRLECTVVVDNHRALAWYLVNGFSVVGLMHRRYVSPDDFDLLNEYVLEREL